MVTLSFKQLRAAGFRKHQGLKENKLDESSSKNVIFYYRNNQNITHQKKTGFDNCLLNTLLHFPFQKPRESLPLTDFFNICNVQKIAF